MIHDNRNSKLVALAALLMLVLSGSAYAGGLAETASSGRYDGAWQVTVQASDGSPAVIDYVAISRDGTLVNIDPDPALSAGIGRWVREPGNRYATTFVHFLNDHGLPIGMVKVRASVEVDGDTFSGPFQTDVILGATVVQTICGTVTATRMETEPVEACP
jgi:hypothetical protein